MSNCCSDLGCDEIGILMLPEPHHGPAGFPEPTCRIHVAFSVPGDFGPPVVRIRLRFDVVLRAAVPEATIDEDRDACAREHDVGSTTPIGDICGMVDAVTQSGGVQPATDRQLDRGVLALVRPHRPSGVLAAGLRRLPAHGKDPLGQDVLRWRRAAPRPGGLSLARSPPLRAPRG